jgi:arsenate reductase
MSTVIYHNPRCSKSRQTLELLQQHQAQFDIIEYLKTPPNRDELENILSLLGLEPRQLMRKGEEEYQALGLDDPALGREALIEAMLSHPRLIERPIVVHQGKAAIGRPPESILEILK